MANGTPKQDMESMERFLEYLNDEVNRIKRNLRRYTIIGVIAGLLGGGLTGNYLTKPRTAEPRMLNSDKSYDLVVRSKIGKYPLLRTGRKYTLADDIFKKEKKKIKQGMKDKKQKKKK